MTPITRVIDAFVAQLAAISTANGHATDIAHIETEAIQINVRSETPLPLLHVRRLTSNVDARAGRGTRKESISLQIEAYLDLKTHGRAGQDALLNDLYNAIYPESQVLLDGLAVAITTGEAELDDAELGSRILPIYLPVTITYTRTR